ncbi:MAG: site-specific DNA-methyltransferase [Gammaproteobacteria bacterium]|nr:MAG: site-specific DNA-methyltransferase [Gammaproteobacteria bacterium]
MLDLMQGDCLELLKDMPSDSVDLVCADMPYGTTQCSWDSPIDLTKLWPELLRVTKDNAAIVLLAQTPFDKVLGCSNLPMLKYEWIWEKTSATGHLNAKKMPMKAHENILIFYNKSPIYNPQKTTGHKRKASTAARKSELYGSHAKTTNYDSTERYPRSVLLFSSDKQKLNLHPTQKPLALMEYIIETYSNKGGHILDFTMGSGTAGVAAMKLDRGFTGMELTDKHYQASRARLSPWLQAD